MKLRALALGAVAGLAMVCTAVTAAAEQSRNLIVVELFTSQGCSSCPPADKLLARLAERADVLPLALHVDYWDYIGWKDAFARPEHTKRQKLYAYKAGKRMIYTPQMVIGGIAQIVGTQPMELADVLAEQRGWTPGAELVVRRDGQALTISANTSEAPDGMILVQVVRFMPKKSVAIHDGENAGHTIDYTNIVTGLDVVSEWNGKAPLELRAEAPGGDRTAVILQAENTGRILAAARAQ